MASQRKKGVVIVNQTEQEWIRNYRLMFNELLDYNQE